MENTNKPTHLAYHVREAEPEDDTSKGHWTEVGAAWLHRDGKGLTVQLRSTPLDGRVVLREPSRKPTME